MADSNIDLTKQHFKRRAEAEDRLKISWACMAWKFESVISDETVVAPLGSRISERRPLQSLSEGIDLMKQEPYDYFLYWTFEEWGFLAYPYPGLMENLDDPLKCSMVEWASSGPKSYYVYVRDANRSGINIYVSQGHFSEFSIDKGWHLLDDDGREHKVMKPAKGISSLPFVRKQSLSKLSLPREIQFDSDRKCTLGADGKFTLSTQIDETLYSMGIPREAWPPTVDSISILTTDGD